MLKFGRLPGRPESSSPRLHLSPYLRTTVAPPPSVDWYSRLPLWPMYLNDRIGDCTVAMVGHTIENCAMYGQSETAVLTDGAILTAYEEITGYNPDYPSTDVGAVLQDVYGYWRKTGVDGHKAMVFAQVDHQNNDEVRLVAYQFGAVGLGIVVTQSMMDDFQDGRNWNRASGEILGGHAVPIVGYDSEYVYVVTWAKLQPMSWSCFRAVAEEAWVAILPEWLSAGKNPLGIDLYGLGQEFASLTGQPNPFPAPTPQPTPDPVPAPDSPDRKLLEELAALIHHIDDAVENGFGLVKKWLEDHDLGRSS